MVVALVLWQTPSNEYIFLPDVAHPVAPLVTVQGEHPHKGHGGIYFVDVLVRKATLLERLFPGIRDGATLVPATALNSPCSSDAARRRQDLREMGNSQSIASAVALRTLGYKVVARPIGVFVSQVAPDAPAACHLQPTDLIVSVDGRPVRTVQELRRAVRRHKPGDQVRFGFRDATGAHEVVVKTVPDPLDPRRPIVGIVLSQAVSVQLPLSIKIDAGGVGGPSAGLPFALDIADELGRNVDRGYRVAATGEIDLSGRVGAIGGVKQKTIGARRAGVEVFLVPAGDNAKEARRYGKGLRIIPVESYRQALQALATLPPRS